MKRGLFRKVNVGDSIKEIILKDSKRRVVYHTPPLPSAPDETIFDRELVFKFSMKLL